jgi:predicted permease
MEWFNILMARLRALFRRESVFQDIEEELRVHVKMETETNIKRGMSPDEARAAALKSFGDPVRNTELGYDIRGGGWLETLRQDLRYGARMLRKNAVYTFVAGSTLALSIGANTAMFSVINTVLLNPLPYEQPDRLLAVWSLGNRNNRTIPTSAGTYIDWREQNEVFDSIAAYNNGNTNLAEGGQNETLSGALVSHELFRVLSVNPILGRRFLPEEEIPGRNRSVILSNRLWNRRFGSDPQVIGRVVQIGGEPHTVVGVMPANFQFPDREVEIWQPATFDRNNLNRGSNIFRVIARLKPGVTLDQAQSQMTALAERMERQYKNGLGARVVPFHEQIVGRVRQTLLILFGAVGLILALGCANVMNLSLTKTASRYKEVAIRAALGANRWRLIRQLMTESFLLSVLGSGIGLLLAVWLTRLIASHSVSAAPRMDEVKVDAWVFAFTLAVTLLTGLVCGLAPALGATKLDLHDALKEEGGRGTTMGSSRKRLQKVLVIAEIALALILLIGASLLIRSFLTLRQVNPGFELGNVLTAQIVLPEGRYREPGERADFYRQVIQRVTETPRVQSVGLSWMLPLSGSLFTRRYAVEGRPVPLPGEELQATYNVVSPAYFRTLKIDLLEGRAFSEQDTLHTAGVVMINEKMARELSAPGESILGKRVRFFNSRDPQPPFQEIVGVVRDVRPYKLDSEPISQIYVSTLQVPYSGMYLLVRTGTDPSDMTAAVRNAILAVDPNQPITNIRAMEYYFSESIAEPQFRTLLMGVFAAIALVLAAVGLYGVISYSVAQRASEFGIRMALGARKTDVLKLVINEGGRLILIGLAIGLGGALAMTRIMANMLYQVNHLDTITFVGTPILLGIIAIVACVVPALRATRIDPAIALRQE